MNGKPTRTLFAAVALTALAVVLASSAQARIPEGNGTQPPSRTAVTEQQAQQGSGTFFVGPGFYAAMTLPTVANERQGSGTFTVDRKICANLDLAIRLAIQQCLSHPVPLGAKVVRTGTGQQAVAYTFPAGYRGLP